MKYVNAYSVGRNYGGPEEGGWWYDSGTPLASIPFTDDTPDEIIDAERDRLRALFAPQFEGNRSRYSVIGDDDLEVYVEDETATHFPTERPHYE